MHTAPPYRARTIAALHTPPGPCCPPRPIPARSESRLPVATNDVLLLEWGRGRGARPQWLPLTNRTLRGDAAPVPRQRAAAAVAGEQLWVFGGLDNFT